MSLSISISRGCLVRVLSLLGVCYAVVEFDWTPWGFIMLSLPIVTLVLKALGHTCRYMFLISDVHLEFTVGNSLTF